MFAREAELTSYGELMLDQNPGCQFCGTVMFWTVVLLWVIS